MIFVLTGSLFVFSVGVLVFLFISIFLLLLFLFLVRLFTFLFAVFGCFQGSGINEFELDKHSVRVSDPDQRNNHRESSTSTTTCTILADGIKIIIVINKRNKWPFLQRNIDITILLLDHTTLFEYFSFGRATSGTFSQIDTEAKSTLYNTSTMLYTNYTITASRVFVWYTNVIRVILEYRFPHD